MDRDDRAEAAGGIVGEDDLLVLETVLEEGGGGYVGHGRGGAALGHGDAAFYVSHGGGVALWVVDPQGWRGSRPD